MKAATFHYFAMLAIDYLDLEDFGMDPESTPLDHFVRTRTKPTKKQIAHLVEVYDKQKLKVKPKGGTEPVDIRDAVLAMGDILGVEAPNAENRGRGRPVISTVMDLSALGDITRKYGFRLRDLADLAGIHPPALSAVLRGPSRITPNRLETLMSAAQMLFTGHKAALKELRKLEKGLDQ